MNYVESWNGFIHLSRIINLYKPWFFKSMKKLISSQVMSQELVVYGLHRLVHTYGNC